MAAVCHCFKKLVTSLSLAFTPSYSLSLLVFPFPFSFHQSVSRSLPPSLYGWTALADLAGVMASAVSQASVCVMS